ncbi:MAG: DUF2278 family protein [Desulfobacterales bacterium]|nr:MAG: DUF2278 family protein [Desulfobacterales bacterium]
MALKNYGVLKGRPIARRLGFGSSPHYQVHLVDDDADYRIAVNVKSQQSPSELLYLIDENYAHPLVDNLKELPADFAPLERAPGGLALDYIRANLFKPDQMIPLPFDVPGPDNDLNEKIDYHVQRALADKNKRRHPLDGIALEPGAVTTVTLPGTTIQLSNQGGIITLLNSDGLKVHGVQYNKNEVSEQGRTIVF